MDAFKSFHVYITDKHVEGKGYKNISEQLDVPVTIVAQIFQKFKIHGTVANLPGCGGRRKIDDKPKRRLKRTLIKEPRKTSKKLKVNFKLKKHQCQISPYVVV